MENTQEGVIVKLGDIRGGVLWGIDHDMVQSEINRIDEEIKNIIYDSNKTDERKYWEVINRVSSLAPQIADALLERRNAIKP